MLASFTPLDELKALESLHFSRDTLKELSLEELMREQDDAQDAYEARARGWAHLLAIGAIGLAAWYAHMQDEVRVHMLQQVLLGGQGSITDPIRVRGLLRKEIGFLSRFAGDLANGEIPHSEEAIGNRAAMYGGTARGEFYREQEMNVPPGFVLEYVSRDDKRTCDPCYQAEGYYMPGFGPMPGQVCLGRARCRCRRKRRWLPAVYESLRHDRVAARLFHPEVTAHAG